jgi:hypothetical protein
MEHKGAKKKSKKAQRGDTTTAAGPVSCSDDVLLHVWRYLAGEYALCVQQGEKGLRNLRLIVDALIGGVSSSLPPFRCFPVRGSSRLRLLCEHGVPLCLGLSPALCTQVLVLRLAIRVVPLLDKSRLQGVEGIADIMSFLRVGDAGHVVLEQQLKNCFRFGLATTADPQLWWDSFRYAVSLGHAHGLVGLMKQDAIALPLADCRIVSSRDLHKLTVSLPCLLGLCRKPTGGSQNMLAIPPSVSTFGARLQWELAMVNAFGVTYPKTDVDLFQMGPFVTDLMYAVMEARRNADSGALSDLRDLIGVYESRMGTLLLMLRMASEASARPEEFLLEKRVACRGVLSPFSAACSPKYVDELLEFAGVTLGNSSFHDTRGLLEESLSVLRLRAVSAGEQPSARSSAAEVEERTEEVNPEDTVGAEVDEDEEAEEEEVWEDAEEEEEEEEKEEEEEEEEEEDVCDAFVWDVLERLVGFHHSFDPSQCLWLLYSMLTPALLNDDDDDDEETVDSPSGGQRAPIASRVAPFLVKLALGAFGSGKSAWPYIVHAGGLWLGSSFVPLERCIWKGGEGDVWEALQRVGCRAGRIVALEPVFSAYPLFIDRSTYSIIYLSV